LFDTGWSMPLSRVGDFSVMDVRGNIVERETPVKTPARYVERSQLRPWGRLVDSMVRDLPRFYGGRRIGLEAIDLERYRAAKRVDVILGRLFAREDLRVAA
jgi:hypothetical protein